MTTNNNITKENTLSKIKDDMLEAVNGGYITAEGGNFLDSYIASCKRQGISLEASLEIYPDAWQNELQYIVSDGETKEQDYVTGMNYIREMWNYIG